MKNENNYGPSEREILQSYSDQLAFLLLPAIIFAVTLIVSGVVGNVVVCYVFCFRLRMRTQHFLYVALAVCDLLTCFVALPTKIAEMRYYYMFDSNFACRLLKFTSVFASVCSSFTLVLIGADRYLKVCRPLGSQMSLRHSRFALTLVLVLSLALSVPTIVFSGIETQKHNVTTSGIQTYNTTPYITVEVSSCGLDDSFARVRIIGDATLFFLFVALIIALTVLYVGIWRAIKKHNRSSFRARFLSREERPAAAITKAAATAITTSSLSTTTTTTITTTTTGSSSSSHPASPLLPTSASSPSPLPSLPISPSPPSADSTPPSTTACPSPAASSPSPSPTSRPSRSTTQPTTTRRAPRGHKATTVALSVTVVFILSYLPYLIFFFVFAIADAEVQWSVTTLVLVNILLQFPFLNAVANPIIYSALHPAFRKECARLSRRLCPCCVLCCPRSPCCIPTERHIS